MKPESKLYQLFVMIFCLLPLPVAVFSADIESALISNSIGMQFVRIPAGAFLMGSPPDEPGRDDDEKQHRVVLTRAFYLGITEVTQGQWRKIMGANPSGYPTLGDRGPVEQVSWNDCQVFIQRLNQREGTGAYRLPTEAEWEYACRAGSRSAFSGGDIVEVSCGAVPALDKMGWFCGNSGFEPHWVAQKMPNAWGLYDMHGNVQEWCLDQCEWRTIWSRRTGVINDTYQDDITDPVSRSGQYRIFRGGSWNQSSAYARAADRNCFRPGARRTYIGFRIVKDLDN